jgi:hypothetical protein
MYFSIMVADRSIGLLYQVATGLARLKVLAANN